ncbi:hypothetical protein H8E07_01490 [bacterium]|nr:hypothetical protein [bacterium]
MAQTPLQTAMTKGADKVPEKQTKNALGQAVGKIANLTKRADKTKAAVVQTGAKVVHTAETQGTLFLSSMAEGYFGAEKLKLGGVDLRGPVAIAAQGYGLFESMSGKGGGHSLAIGNGLMGSWLASVAVKAGQKLRAGKDAPPAPQPPTGIQGEEPAPAVLPAPVTPVHDLAGPVREVTLTPEPVPVPARSSRSDGRFVRARQD